jgi:ribosomal protein S18 acetylase RimI-like enzyme
VVTGPSSAITVRRASLLRHGDACHYRRLLDAYARDPMGQDAPLPGTVLDRVIADLSQHPAARIFLAEQEGKACGFATCFLGYSTFRGRPLLNIHDIAVLPQWRGRGIARAILGAVADLARAEGCCKITLEVRDDNPAAEALYRSEGFGSAVTDDGQQVQYLFMEKPLA